MNSTFRTVSAFMRHQWCIEPVYAEQHLPLLEAFFKGQLSPKAFSDDEHEDDKEESSVSRRGYALAVHSAGSTGNQGAAATQGTAANSVRYALDDSENTPEGSVAVIDIRGTILKESSCCALGTEDYCQMLEAAYANDKIIGVVCLVDSPGGQLSGTPTLYDAIRDPRKPTVSVVNEGLMASAAYWLACGSDYIYATQQTDQIGSIGVFVQLQDRTEANAKLGIKTLTIYSDRSSEKNKPYRDALAGDDKLLREDLNQAADLFRAAVEQGRGTRLKPTAKNGPDVFKGAVFYAGQAIELGLIDGYGNLGTAIAKVVELHNAKLSDKSGSSDVSVPADAPRSAEVPTPDVPTASTASVDVVEPIITESQNPTPNTDMFGFVNLAALAAIKGMASADVTDAHITALNEEFSKNGYNVAAVSETQFKAAQELQAQLNTASSSISTKDQEIARLNGEIARLGKLPGSTPTQVQKVEEPTASGEGNTNPFFSEADAELAKMRSKMN